VTGSVELYPFPLAGNPGDGMRAGRLGIRKGLLAGPLTGQAPSLARVTAQDGAEPGMLGRSRDIAGVKWICRCPCLTLAAGEGVLGS
jgi:hypothetical protein